MDTSRQTKQKGEKGRTMTKHKWVLLIGETKTEFPADENSLLPEKSWQGEMVMLYTKIKTKWKLVRAWGRIGKNKKWINTKIETENGENVITLLP